MGTAGPSDLLASWRGGQRDHHGTGNDYGFCHSDDAQAQEHHPQESLLHSGDDVLLPRLHHVHHSPPQARPALGLSKAEHITYHARYLVQTDKSCYGWRNFSGGQAAVLWRLHLLRPHHGPHHCLPHCQDSLQEFSMLHGFSFCLFLTGISALLLGHGHYSIGVLLGYWVTTRTWAMYHTMANHTILKTRDKHNTIQTLWWWRFFIFLEGNVPGPLPQDYSWPVPAWARRGLGRLWARL